MRSSPWPDGNPVDHIVTQVIAAGASKHCAGVWLLAGPQGPQGTKVGCLATVGDTTVYFYQDTTGPIVVAGREWQAGQAGHGGIPPAVDSLQNRFTQAYGESTDCFTKEKHVKDWVSLQKQWHYPPFTVQLVVAPASYSDSATIFLQFIRGTMSCDLADAIEIGPRPLRLRKF